MTSETTPTLTAHDRAAKIAALNDAHRRSHFYTVMTATVAALPRAERDALLRGIAAFEKFDGGNDPYGEHDFGALTLAGERFFFKIDYYDVAHQGHSPDPSDEAVTRRIMTVMRADEY